MSGAHRDLHVLTHSFPTRRSSDLCKYALPHMLARGMGAILFTSSTSAFAGDVGQFSYGASKAMVNWYIKTIATTFGKQRIRCNGIVPGLIQTPALEDRKSTRLNSSH